MRTVAASEALSLIIGLPPRTGRAAPLRPPGPANRDVATKEFGGHPGLLRGMLGEGEGEPKSKRFPDFDRPTGGVDSRMDGRKLSDCLAEVAEWQTRRTQNYPGGLTAL